MNNKIVVGVFAAIILVLGSLSWLNARNQPRLDQNQPGRPASVLSAAETAYDFGTVSMAAGNVTKTFTIKNTSSSTVTINRMYTSCMCTTAILQNGESRRGPFGMPGHGSVPYINEELQPGAEAAVEVIFDPAAHGPAGVGRIERVVYLETGTTLPFELGISATVTP